MGLVLSIKTYQDGVLAVFLHNLQDLIQELQPGHYQDQSGVPVLSDLWYNKFIINYKLMTISKSRFDIILKRVYFQGGGFFSSGANSDQKKEYIKTIFDDAFDSYGDGRALATIEEWQEIKAKLLSNKRDVLTDQDIEILSKAIEVELKLK